MKHSKRFKMRKISPTFTGPISLLQKLPVRPRLLFTLNWLESHLDEGYLILELSADGINTLKKFGYRLTPASNYIENRNQRLNQILSRITSAQSTSIQSIPGYSCYETVEETLSEAASMVTTNPSLAELIDVGDSWEKTQNLGGFDIQVLKLTNNQVSGCKTYFIY